MENKGPYTITHQQVEHILSCLRSVDYARQKLHDNDPDRHTHVITELKAAANGIYGVMAALPKNT